MIRVSTLGSVSVRNARGDLALSLLNQPKRLAVFVYLAVVSEESPLISRDRLCGMFWPDSDPDRANQTLSQALLYIRRALGDDVITGKGQAALRINESVECDVVEFIRAYRDGDFERALATYTGAFLDAFAPAASPDFEEWAETQRYRFRTMAADSARKLRDIAIEKGNTAEGARWAQRVVDLSDVSDTDSAILIELLIDIGDRAGALRAYDDLAARLREDHDLEPTAATRALVASPQTDVQRHEVVPEPVANAKNTAASEPRHSRRSSVLVTAGSTALAIVFFGLWGMHTRTAASSVVTTPVITVEDASSGANEAVLGSRLATKLIAKLRVDSRVRTRMAPATTRDGDGEPESANEYVLRTAVSMDDEKPVAVATLFNAHTGITLHQLELDASASPDSVARAIVVDMRRALGRDIEYAALRRRITNPRALGLINAAYIQQVVADTLRTHRAFTTAQLALEKADSLLSAIPSSESADADVMLAHADVQKDLMWVRFVSARGSSKNARQAMVKGLAFAEAAIDAAPKDARALEAAGTFTHFLAVTTPQDSSAAREAMIDRSLGYLNDAVRADPSRAYAWSVISALLLRRGDYQNAYRAAAQGRYADVYQEQAEDLDIRMFSSALQVGDLTAARTACDDFRRDVGSGYFAATCQLQLLAWLPERGEKDDAMIERLVNAPAAQYMASERAHLRMLAATYYARHHLPDRARTMALNAAATSASEDTELLRVTAWYHTVRGDFASARKLLDRIAILSPSEAAQYAASAEFAPLKAQGRSYGVQ